MQLLKQKAAEVEKEQQAFASRLVELDGCVAKQLKGIIEVRFK